MVQRSSTRPSRAQSKSRKLVMRRTAIVLCLRRGWRVTGSIRVVVGWDWLGWSCGFPPLRLKNVAWMGHLALVRNRALPGRRPGRDRLEDEKSEHGHLCRYGWPSLPARQMNYLELYRLRSSLQVALSPSWRVGGCWRCGVA